MPGRQGRRLGLVEGRGMPARPRPSDGRSVTAPRRGARGGSCVRPCRREVPAPEDPGPDHPGDAVFHPHRAVLRRLVPSVCGLLRRDADGASGGGGRAALPEPPSGGTLGGGQDAESGLQRRGLSVQTCPGASAGECPVCADQAPAAVAGGPDAGGGPATLRGDGRDLRPDGAADVRHRDAADGVSPAAGGGPGFRPSNDHRA